ncbi:MAG: SusC/RagA family TonB-linked outer membrane protein [Paludibacteraceae bacterium]|nr:SusC/RagA family TonB-linked outer membrane protein [Paludibacteraceae bacterium]
MKKTLLLLCLTFLGVASALAQNVDVSGVVYDETGEAAIGVNITIVGTTAGTMSDFDGKFELSVPKGKRLEFSYVGYATQVLDAKSNMVVRLKPESQQLSEVVVTGIAVYDKRITSGASTSINAAESKLDGVADISRSLEGRSSGVSVQNVSGTFGTAPKIRVRGATSIYGTNKPLWVVDGVPLEDAVNLSADDLSSGDAATLIASSISGINADDIESFNILKDGSATSIYGARAMAGVIVVTTKKGRAGHSSLNYTGEFTYRLKPSYHDYNIMNSQEQMAVYQELEQKGWLEYTTLKNAKSYGVYGKMYNLINTYDPTTGGFAMPNTLEARNAYLRLAEFRNTDWFDLLFNHNIMQNHSLSFSGGTDKARFYASLSALYDPGWYKSSKVSRYTGNVNASFNIMKNLTLSMATMGSFRQQRAPGTIASTPNPLTGNVERAFDINPFAYASNNSRVLDPDENYRNNYCDFNIFDELNNNYIDIKFTDLKFQLEADYKPTYTPGLTLHALGAIRYVHTSQEHNITDKSNQARAYRAGIEPVEDEGIRSANENLYTDPDDPAALPEIVMPLGGIYDLKEYSMLSTDFRFTADYTQTFGKEGHEEDHYINALVGVESNATNRQGTGFEGYGYQYENGGIPYLDYRLFKQKQEEGSNYFNNDFGWDRSLAFFGTATYAWRSRYSITGTIRYEGSNQLGRSRRARWLPTWNVSGAWNAHEEFWWNENRFKAAKWWNTCKLRLSYSLTAERGDASNSLAIFQSYSPYRPFASVTESGIELADLENSELTYEKKHEFNVGLDLGFFNNRLNIEFDYYTRNNFDLIGLVQTSGIGGAIDKVANAASLKSSGCEFTISTLNIDKRLGKSNFRWSTDLIFSYATNKITELSSYSRLSSFVNGNGYAMKGYPVRALFSVPFAGLDENGMPTFYTNPEHTETTMTGINFQQYDNLDFLKYEGPVDPTITGSFNNTFSWNGIKLNIFFTYSFGNVLRLQRLVPVNSNSDYSDLVSSRKEFKNRWMVPGDEKYTDIPVIPTKRQFNDISDLNTAYSAYNFSDKRVAKGDFIRLKEIAISYDFPREWFQRQTINKDGSQRVYKHGSKKGQPCEEAVKSFSVKFSATNICLIYADKKLNGQDPEYFSTGGVSSPVPRQFTFTVRMGM